MSYRVPLLSEVRELPWNGLTVASLFAGCGGSSTGYRMAGCRVAYANEFVEAAARTYRLNCAPETVVDMTDIRDLEGISFEPDIIDASPPCTSFSSAGRRELGWGKKKAYSGEKEQRSDDLFFEFVRILRDRRPKVFVAENVAGLIKGTAKGVFIKIMGELKASGYRVEARLLDAQWLGVPQVRARLIFIGVRDNLTINPSDLFPKPFPERVTLREAFRVPLPLRGDLDKGPSITRYAIGKEAANLPPGGWSKRYFQLFRASLDLPSQTITASGGVASLANVIAPCGTRKFDISELIRVCGFPDDWRFPADLTYQERWERLGRAVPPIMMRSIAERIRDAICGP